MSTKIMNLLLTVFFARLSHFELGYQLPVMTLDKVASSEMI
jgi:hypothetical protein